MKSYRVARRFLWSVTTARIVLTIAAGVAYVLAVTHPTPLGTRLFLLACMITFGWLYYVRLPRMPTQIDYDDYRDVGGVKFPFEYRFTWLDGRYTAKLSKVEPNVTIDAAKFGRPTAK